MAISNSCETETLKFDNMVGVLLSEEVCRKSPGSAETSGSALSVDQRGRSGNREEKEWKVEIQIGERYIQVKVCGMLAVW